MKITITIEVPDNGQPVVSINSNATKSGEYDRLTDAPPETVVYVVPWAVYTWKGSYYISVPHGAVKHRRQTFTLPVSIGYNRDAVKIKRTDFEEAIKGEPDILHEMDRKWHDEDLPVSLI